MTPPLSPLETNLGVFVCALFLFSFFLFFCGVQLTGHVDVCLSHDWPRGIARYGDAQSLFRKKPFFKKEVLNWLVKWIDWFGWLVGWFIDSLLHCFIDWFIHWLVDSLIGWLIDWLLHWFIDWLTRWLVDSLIRWFVDSYDWLFCCFMGSVVVGIYIILLLVLHCTALNGYLLTCLLGSSIFFGEEVLNGWVNELIGLLIDWLINWLVGVLVDWVVEWSPTAVLTDPPARPQVLLIHTSGRKVLGFTKSRRKETGQKASKKNLYKQIIRKKCTGYIYISLSGAPFQIRSALTRFSLASLARKQLLERWRTTAWAASRRSNSCTRYSPTTGSRHTSTSSSPPSWGGVQLVLLVGLIYLVSRRCRSAQKDG